MTFKSHAQTGQQNMADMQTGGPPRPHAHFHAPSGKWRRPNKNKNNTSNKKTHTIHIFSCLLPFLLILLWVRRHFPWQPVCCVLHLNHRFHRHYHLNPHYRHLQAVCCSQDTNTNTNAYTEIQIHAAHIDTKARMVLLCSLLPAAF